MSWLYSRVARACFGCLLLCASAGRAQDWKDAEYRTKAIFLTAFPRFVDWPENAFASEKSPLLLCVVGDFPFGISLAQMAQTSSAGGRRIEVHDARKAMDLRSCHILFISRSEAGRYDKILKLVQGASVLTVGETPDFLASGGAIEFLFDADKLRFAVNLAAAQDARLTISSKMLALAHHVIRGDEPKTSAANHCVSR